MSNITRQINLNLDVDALPSPIQEVIDADTGERLQFWRANSLDFSIVFSEGSSDFDMTAVGMVSLEVKWPKKIDPPSPEFPLLMYKEVEGPFVTGNPVVISFDANETAIRHGSQWLSVTLYGADGERMTTVSGFVFVMGNGYGTTNVPDVEDLRDEAVQAARDSEEARDQSCACAQVSSNEADRAQQIADNLEALSTSLSYRGVWSSSSTPPDAQRGWFWMIGEPVTFASRAWEVGDAALYNGSLWQAVPIQWLLEQVEQDVATLRDRVMGGRNHLALREGWAVISNADGLRPGTSSFTIASWVRIPAGAPNAMHLFGTAGMASPFASDAWAVGYTSSGGGRIQTILTDGSGGFATPDAQSLPAQYDAWANYAVIYDAPAREYRGYLNGVQVGQYVFPSEYDLVSANNFGIGRGHDNIGALVGPAGLADIGETVMLSFAATADDVRKLMVGDIPIEWRGGSFAENTANLVAIGNWTTAPTGITPEGFSNIVQAQAAQRAGVYSRPLFSTSEGDIVEISGTISDTSSYVQGTNRVRVGLFRGDQENFPGWNSYDIIQGSGTVINETGGNLWVRADGDFRIRFHAEEWQGLQRAGVGWSAGGNGGEELRLSNLRVKKNGVVLHLDPRNIGPAPSQWIEPHGHHALYHDTGADSAQELEDARYLKFNYTILPGAPDIVLGGARPIIPEGWSVTYVGIASSGGTAVTYHLYYTDGTSQTEFAEIETLGTPGSSNGQAHPAVASGRFDDPLNPFFGRVAVSFSGGAGVTGTITLKIEKIV